MENDSSMTIIYDDEEIRVIWSPGSSAFVMITFGDLTTPAKDLRFFADVPLRKLGITVIGVMAKRANWYPSEYFEKALCFIVDKMDGYKTRIAYGGSMGGYAAIKFSSLLAATHVIALCPQWSINPADCQGADPGWGTYYLTTMSGMAIRTKDVVGEVFLFADSFDARENFHARTIIKNYPAAHFINVPAVEHHVTAVFAGTGNLQQLIEACCNSDIMALRMFSRRTRRSHSIWINRILRHAMRKLPRLGIHLLVNAGNFDLLRENLGFFPQVLSHLATTAGVQRAIAFYEDSWSLLPNLVEQNLVCAYLVGLAGGRVALVTTHVSRLIYNLSENRVEHKCLPFEPWEIPVEVELFDFSTELFVSVGGSKFRLSVSGNGELHVSVIKGQGVAGFRFNIMPADNGWFTISYGGRYLCADKHRKIVSCDRTTAHEWEMFRFGP